MRYKIEGFKIAAKFDLEARDHIKLGVNCTTAVYNPGELLIQRLKAYRPTG